MEKFAVIDIGSNSVRLMFVANGKVLYKRLQTTRLGEGLATNAHLKLEAIERTAQAVAHFYAVAKEEGAEKTVAFATAAARSAKNGSAFVKRVFELCSLEVEIVSGETEAELGIVGALGNCDGVIADMGGASTEIACKKDGEIIYRKSVDIGVVRIKDEYGTDRAKIAAAAKRAALAYGQVPACKRVCGIGGTATTLAAIALGLQEYDAEKVTGAVITAQKMDELASELLAKTPAQIAQIPCVSKGREEVLAGGAAMFAELMKLLDIEEMFVSDRDNLEGYAIKKGWLK